MISKERQNFNNQFTKEKYSAFLADLEHGLKPIPFRVAETPVFVPKGLTEQLVKAGEEIIALIISPNFKELTNKAIPKLWEVPNENDHPHFLTFDFGISKNAQGELEPMLIEMQGFPSLYGFQMHLAETFKKHYEISDNLDYLLNGFDKETYIALLKKVILGTHEAKHVAIMDVDAENQKTAIDFLVTQKQLGIKILSVDEIYRTDNKLFYHESGEEIQLKRIYNRLIFDEIENDELLFKNGFDPRKPIEVEWVTHPNWFYRISKFTMPFLNSKFVPETHFLNNITEPPKDLENYVLKPLFSFAGMGVIIDVKQSDIDEITDPENWILQKKVAYEPAVEAPDGGVKVEIRLMYLWADGEQPQLCINLARLSKGKMIGVRYNADFDWVGGTIGFMEQ